MQPGTVLVTGGTGKTGARVAAQLAARGAVARVAARDPARTAAPGAVRFDWSDRGTHDAALAEVRAVYLVAPPVLEPLAVMEPFVRRALARGVRRFVLLSASALDAGDPLMGRVHALLAACAPEWTVLRPSWFMQNFTEQHLPTIRSDGAIYTATGAGRVPFVHAGDIAAVAVEALCGPRSLDRAVRITGPCAISYDEAAAQIGGATGRAVAHRALSEQELAARLSTSGMDPAYAALLAAMDVAIARGAEDCVSTEVERLTGRSPAAFETFVAQERARWMDDT